MAAEGSRGLIEAVQGTVELSVAGCHDRFDWTSYMAAGSSVGQLNLSKLA